MPEALQTRTEHSRSLADAEMYRALETLKEVGLLIPLTDLETFHGRAGTEGETWMIDPTFANGGNDTGNYNINNRPTLYAGNRQDAEGFAAERTNAARYSAYIGVFENKVRSYTPQERQAWLDRANEVRQKRYKNLPDILKPMTFDDLNPAVESRRLEHDTPLDQKEDIWRRTIDSSAITTEIHDIVASDMDAVVLNLDFDRTELDDATREKYKHALRTLAIPITEGSPVGWEARASARLFREAVEATLKGSGGGVIPQAEVGKLAAEAGIDERIASQLASAYNARRMVLSNPVYLASQFIKQPGNLFIDTFKVNGQIKEVPINLEYAQQYFRQAHIVGVRQRVNSGTLGRHIASVPFFDLEKVTTTEGLAAARRVTWQRLGGMATALGGLINPEVGRSQPLLRLLEDVHAQPGTLVAAARAVKGYNDIFAGDTGVWEGFTLAEHTETVLRNFDENYANNLPVELLAPLRLAILAHDIGKPAAVDAGEKHRHKEYTATQANAFLDKLGVDERLKGLLLAIIDEGQTAAYQLYMRNGGKPAQTAMKKLAVKTLSQFYGSDIVTDEQVGGFTELCKILQVCNSGAYTSMAITRKGDGNGRHRNAPSFNASFAQPVGFGKRALRLRQAGDKPAASDLTPSATKGW